MPRRPASSVSPCPPRLRSSGSRSTGPTPRPRTIEGKYVAAPAGGQPWPAIQDGESRLRDPRERAQDRRPALARAPGAGPALFLVLLGADHASPLAGPRARPGLRSTEPPPLPAWPFSAGRAADGLADRADRQPAAAEHLRRLDDLLSSVPAEDLTFAECFTRWDSGTYPLIVDRLALGGAGYAQIPVRPGRHDSREQPLCQRTLQQYGLAWSVDSLLLVTALAEASRFDRAARWFPAIWEVMLWGSDRSDRFQSVARWRGGAHARRVPGQRAGGPAQDTSRLGNLPVLRLILARQDDACGDPRRAPGTRSWLGLPSCSWRP